MTMKHWLTAALRCLEESLDTVAHEVNELDWKARLSEHRDRLAEHLMAFSNHPNGGCLVFGIVDSGQPEGIDQASVAQLANTLANLGRDAVEPPLALDHAVVDFRGTPLLWVHIPESLVKPVHRRGKSIEETWIRSAGTTRKASRQEVGTLMLHSASARWEELRASSLLTLEQARAMLDVDTIAGLLQRPLPGDPAELGRWLNAEGLTVPDGSGHYVTNFGAIAAARKLGEFASLLRKRTRVIRYRGTNKVDTIDEQPGQRGYAVGFEGLIAYLKRALPHSEVIQQSLRTEVSHKHRNQITNLIGDAVAAGRIKRKDAGSGKKFAEYLPYWV